MTLRDEFVPFLLSWYGFHRTPSACAAIWNDTARSESQLADEIARAAEWLSQWSPTTSVNRKAGSSYSLKHVAERWHEVRAPRRNAYIGNGSLVMAALRLRFVVEPTRNWSGDARDFCNAWLGVPRPAGEYPHVVYDSRGKAWLDKDPARPRPLL